MPERFAAKLRELMDASDISGAALGRKLGGVDKSQVSRWRNDQDRPEPATIVKIADVFGVDQIGMLQLAEVLSGEPPDIDPERASLMLIVRDDVPDEELTVVRRFLRTYRNERARSRSHAKTRQSGTAKTTDGRITDRPEPDENGSHNPLSGWYPSLGRHLATA